MAFFLSDMHMMKGAVNAKLLKEDCKMEEKIEEVIKQYPIQLVGKRRIRGAILLETKEGLFTLINYKDSLKKLAFQEQVKHVLIEGGYPYVDEGIPNLNQELLTRDGRGNRWLLKRWFKGRECNLRDEKEICLATGHLAKIHNMMILPEAAFDAEEEGEPSAGIEVSTDKNISEIIERHIREMKRVHNYIRNKRKRNEMEICILKLYPEFYEQASCVQNYFSEVDCIELQKKCITERRVYHGNYNYHNILFQEQQLVTTNFEGASMGVQIIDLYDFLRKIMEKNNWDEKQGVKILDEYQKVRPLERAEARFLYLLLLFPEKFWKQINFYYNGKKSWMSMKNYEKLLKIQSQEEKRRIFLSEAKSLLF